MSMRAMLWALYEAPAASPAEAMTLLVLAEHAGPSDSPWSGAYPSHSTIAKAARISDRTVRRCLRDLESRGVIRRGDQAIVEKYRSDKRPVVWDLNGSARRERGDTVSARSECPPGQNGYERGDTVSYKPVTKPKPNGASKDAPARDEYPADFQEFWSHYPSRGKHPNPKKSAYSKWKTAIKTTDPQVLVNAVKAYASSELPADRQMIPQAATWLSQARWEEQDTTAPDEWLKDCWRKGDTASITERTGLIYGGVVWPDEPPQDPEEKAWIRLQQARTWIEINHDRIVGRMSHAV